MSLKYEWADAAALARGGARDSRPGQPSEKGASEKFSLVTSEKGASEHGVRTFSWMSRP